MYLTCPKCLAVFETSESYFTDGDKRVRCSACKNVWVAGLSTEQTINDLMGESADEAFQGLHGFLDKSAKPPHLSKPSPPSPPPKPSRPSRHASPPPPIALSQMVPKKSPYEPISFFSRLVKLFKTLLILIGIMIIAGIAGAIYFSDNVMQYFPETKPIYEFVLPFYDLAEMTLIELWNWGRELLNR